MRTAFLTDGAGRFTHQVGDRSADDLAVDIDVLFGSVGAFSAARLGGAKVMVLTGERGVIVARRWGDATGGVLGVFADDAAALGVLIRHLSHASPPPTDGVER